MLQQLIAFIFPFLVSVAPGGLDSVVNSSSSSVGSSNAVGHSSATDYRPGNYAEVGHTEDLFYEQQIEWWDAEVLGPREVSLKFMGGLESCNGYRVEVTETSTTVTINLINGWPTDSWPDDDKLAFCPDVGYLNKITVTTEDPVLFKTVTQDPVKPRVF